MFTIFTTAFLFFVIDSLCIRAFNKTTWCVKLSKKQLVQIGEGVPSTMNALVNTCFAFVIVSDNLFWENKLTHSTYLSNNLVQFITGYFLYDLIICIKRFNYSGVLFLMHGIICLSASLLVNWYNIGHFYIASRILYEISNPFMYACKFSKLVKLSSCTQTICNVLFACTFFMCRIVWGIFSWIVLFRNSFDCDDNTVNLFRITVFLDTCLLALNLYWFTRIINIIYKELCSNNKRFLHTRYDGSDTQVRQQRCITLALTILFTISHNS